MVRASRSGSVFVLLSLTAIAACSSNGNAGFFGNDASAPRDASAGSDAAHEASTGSDSAGGPDAAPADGGVCDPAAQTGCPAGDKCTFFSTDGGPVAPGCEPAGTVQTGQACALGTPPHDDCVAGDICVRFNTNLPSTCTPICVTDADCKQAPVAAGSTPEPNNKGYCLQSFSAAGSNDMLCTVACNPVAAAGPSGCAAGLRCAYGSTNGIQELTDCLADGTLGEGAACDGVTTICAAGSQCVGPATGGTGTCRAMCRAGMDSDCTIGTNTKCMTPSGATNPMFGFCCAPGGC